MRLRLSFERLAIVVLSLVIVGLLSQNKDPAHGSRQRDAEEAADGKAWLEIRQSDDEEEGEPGNGRHRREGAVHEGQNDDDVEGEKETEENKARPRSSSPKAGLFASGQDATAGGGGAGGDLHQTEVEQAETAPEDRSVFRPRRRRRRRKMDRENDEGESNQGAKSEEPTHGEHVEEAPAPAAAAKEMAQNDEKTSLFKSTDVTTNKANDGGLHQKPATSKSDADKTEAAESLKENDEEADDGEPAETDAEDDNKDGGDGKYQNLKDNDADGEAADDGGEDTENENDPDDTGDDDLTGPSDFNFTALSDGYASAATPGQNLSAVEETAAARKRYLTTECERRGLSNKGWPRIPANMLVSDRFKVMYCMIGKVASSSWKKVFLMAAGRLDTRRADEFQHRSVGAKALKVLRPMSGRKNPTNERRLATYYKFLFVRHPLDRLVSAFLEKFRLVRDYQETIGRRIIRRYRQNATEESLARGHDVTLEEFTRFLIDHGRTSKNIHWTPQYDLCLPCSVQYDFVGHHETLWDDGDYVLRRIGVGGLVRFPRWGGTNRTSSGGSEGTGSSRSLQRYEQMFAGVRPEYVRRIKKYYAHDYEFFGYK